METRKCKVCGEVKPITEYYKYGGYYDTKCKVRDDDFYCGY